MSKVVCEICGTAFAETASQCPICGTAKSESAQNVAGGEQENNGYAYVKGGRFSQSNVRRHNSGKGELPRVQEETKPQKPVREEPVRKNDTDEDERPRRRREAPPSRVNNEVQDLQPNEEAESRPRRRMESSEAEPRPRRRAESSNAQPQRRPRPQKREEPENEQPSNIGLIVVVVILLLAIISLCAYIAIRYIDMNNNKNADQSSSSTFDPGGNSSAERIPCTELSIVGPTEHTFESLGEEFWVDVSRTPVDTTDLISCDYDPNIVSVGISGNRLCISPVGIGVAEITVHCGDASTTLTIICNLSNVPCTGMDIGGLTEYTFSSGGDQLTITVNCQPATTTDPINYSYDATIIDVVLNGNQLVIKPAGMGTTDLVISCGEQSITVRITSSVSGSYDPDFVLELSSTDISMFYYGETARIYNGTKDASEIHWYSDDESICTITNGVVTALSPGTTYVYGQYGETTVRCIVRCRDSVVKPEDPDFYLSHSDVTISIGETLNFSLRAADGTKVTEGVTFYASEEGFFTVDENGKVVGVATTMGIGRLVYLCCEYEGVVYKCIVRVRNT